MKKYITIFSMEMKKSLAYRSDTWLTALFSIFSVVLAYLLWKAVFGDHATVNGFTLPEMTAYYLLTVILSPFLQDSGMLNEFSAEIKSGQYAKYIIKPMSPLGYFIAASLGKTLFQTIVSFIVMGIATCLFPSYFAGISLRHFLTALPVIWLGALLSMMINFIIAMATFRLTDIGFLYAIQNVLKLFLSGTMLPLSMVFGNTLPLFSPFSYTLYYPVMFCIGRADIPFALAAIVSALWVAVLGFIALLLQKRAVKSFEGVGL